MGLEVATYISQLNPLNPVGAVDPKAQGDDHIRLMKSTIQASFPNIAGAMTVSHTTLNQWNGLAGNYSWSGVHKFADGTAGAPSISFVSDPDTGFSKPGADLLDINTGGGIRMRFANGNILSQVVHGFSDGTAGLPGIYFLNDTDNGLTRPGADLIDIVTGGGSRMRFANGNIISQVVHAFSDGAVALPGMYFANDTDTGVYRSNTNAVGFATNGGFSGEIRTVTATPQFFGTDGSATEPYFSFYLDPNTGFYRIGADQIGLTTGGTLRLAVSTTAFVAALPWQGPDGSLGAPAFSFSGDTNTGVYRIGVDNPGMVAGGALIMDWFAASVGGARVADYGGTMQTIGYRGIPQNSQSVNYTLVLADAGKHILHPNGGGAGDTFTIPTNASVAYDIGTVLTFINRDTNNVSIAITTDTLILAGTTTTGTRTLAQNGVATAIKVEATTWLISGTGLS